VTPLPGDRLASWCRQRRILAGLPSARREQRRKRRNEEVACNELPGGREQRRSARRSEARFPRFRWDDRATVEQLAARLGASVRTHEGEIVFARSSPEAYLHDQETQHPMTIAARGLLQHAGTYDAVRAQTLDALRRGSEEGTFNRTSRYRVMELRRHRESPRSA
jgi:hypothetical protein